MQKSIGVIGNVGCDIIHAQNIKKEQVGGSATYTAFTINLFPFNVAIYSRIGRDFPSDYISEIKNLGISTRYLKKMNGKSANFEIEYDSTNSANYLKLNLGVSNNINYKDIKISKDIVAFHLSPLEPKKQLLILKKIKENSDGIISINTHISCIKKSNLSILKKIIDLSDFFIINEEESMLLTKTKRVDIAIEKLAKNENNIHSIKFLELSDIRTIKEKYNVIAKIEWKSSQKNKNDISSFIVKKPKDLKFIPIDQASLYNNPDYIFTPEDEIMLEIEKNTDFLERILTTEAGVISGQDELYVDKNELPQPKGLWYQQ